MDSLPLNLLLFPLVGGYYIETRYESFKYVSQRLGSQAILFNSILLAMPLLVISLAITTISTVIFPDQVNWIKSHAFPIKQEFFGTCLLSLVIAYLFVRIRNIFIDEKEAITKAITVIGNELELLFSYSCVESQLIQVTLKNDKVYIGWVKVLPKPSQCPYVQIIPLLSGYRNDLKELVLTTDYSSVYTELVKRGKIMDINDAEMNLVVQVNEVISASKFDFDVFESFSNSSKSNP